MDIRDYLKTKTPVFKSDGTLFGIDWETVRKTNRCPLCGSKLYPSQKFPDSILCRSKTHKFFKIKKYHVQTKAQ